MKELKNLKQYREISKVQQKNVQGGGFPYGELCFCIYTDQDGFLVISEDLPCNSTCPDGSSPTPF